MGTAWKAMADDSRRQVLLLLNEGEKTPTELAGNFEFTLAALSTHLRVLREANLVLERRDGQHRYYSVNKDKMAEMVSFFDGFWNDALANLKRHAEEKQRKGVG